MDGQLLPLVQMVNLTKPWTKGLRTLFESIPVIAPLYQEVEEIHTLCEQMRHVQVLKAEKKLLHEELKEVDHQHDQLLTAISLGLEAAAAWNEAKPDSDPAKTQALLDLKTALLPEGLVWTQQAYLEEVGHALQVIKLLENEQREQLKNITLDGKTIYELLERWQELGLKMAEILGQCATIDQDLHAPVSHCTARKEWLGIVALVDKLLVISKTPQSAYEQLMGPIHQAIKKQAYVMKEERAANPAARRRHYPDSPFFNLGEGSSDSKEITDPRNEG